MNILAIDTSGPVCGTAVRTDAGIRASSMVLNQRTHSVNLMPMVDTVLQAAGLTLAEMDRLAVVVGPGSFTGVRLGVSTVKGLAHGAGKPCVAVNALEAMALGVGMFPGLICPVQDARAGQVYAALFRSGETRPVRLWKDEPLKVEVLAARLRELGEPVLFTGDGMPVQREKLRALLGSQAVFAQAPFAFLRPEAVAELAARTEETVDYLTLMPLYLRAPSAERNRRLMEAAHEQ